MIKLAEEAGKEVIVILGFYSLQVQTRLASGIKHREEQAACLGL